MHLPEITSHSTGGGPLSYVLLPEGGGGGGGGGGLRDGCLGIWKGPRGPYIWCIHPCTNDCGGSALRRGRERAGADPIARTAPWDHAVVADVRLGPA